MARDDDEQRLEADKIDARILELYDEPIEGSFDVEHLKAIHAHIFQDFPKYDPGVIRSDTDSWMKTRVLEGHASGYIVHYESQDVEQKITDILADFGGLDALTGLQPDEAATQLGQLYGDLDRAHGFYEGNSRTLREFTREIAQNAGFELDWIQTGADQNTRNTLYRARDYEVLQRAFPDVTIDNAQDRKELEAAFVIESLASSTQGRSLGDIILAGLTEAERETQIEREGMRHTMARHDHEQRPELRATDLASGKETDLSAVVDEALSNRRAGVQEITPDQAVRAIVNIDNSLSRGAVIDGRDVRNLPAEMLWDIHLNGDDALLKVYPGRDFPAQVSSNTPEQIRDERAARIEEEGRIDAMLDDRSQSDPAHELDDEHER